jgi:hypothetical protein
MVAGMKSRHLALYGSPGMVIAAFLGGVAWLAGQRPVGILLPR